MISTHIFVGKGWASDDLGARRPARPKFVNHLARNRRGDFLVLILPIPEFLGIIFFGRRYL